MTVLNSDLTITPRQDIPEPRSCLVFDRQLQVVFWMGGDFGVDAIYIGESDRVVDDAVAFERSLLDDVPDGSANAILVPPWVVRIWIGTGSGKDDLRSVHMCLPT